MIQFFASAIKSLQVGCCGTDRKGDKARKRPQPLERIHQPHRSNKFQTLQMKRDFDEQSQDHKVPLSPGAFLNDEDVGHFKSAQIQRNGSYDSDQQIQIYTGESQSGYRAQIENIDKLEISNTAPMDHQELLHQSISLIQGTGEDNFYDPQNLKIEELNDPLNLLQAPPKLTPSIIKTLSSNRNYQEYLRSQRRHSNYSETDSKGSDQQKRNIKLWTPDEDRLLIQLHREKGGKWSEIARQIPGRNISQCSQRWRRIRPQQQRKAWSKEEDQLVVKMAIEKKKNWGEIAAMLNGRSGKQIRERYINKLDPSINHEPWTQDEDNTILKLYYAMGSRWSQISNRLKGRPENMVKNRFYSHLRKLFISNDSNGTHNTEDASSPFHNSGYNDSDTEDYGNGDSEDDGENNSGEKRNSRHNNDQIKLEDLNEDSSGNENHSNNQQNQQQMLLNQFDNIYINDPNNFGIIKNEIKELQRVSANSSLENSVSPIVIIQEPINPQLNSVLRINQINQEVFTNTFAPLDHNIQSYSQQQNNNLRSSLYNYNEYLIQQSLPQQNQFYGQQQNQPYQLQQQQQQPVINNAIHNLDYYENQNQIVSELPVLQNGQTNYNNINSNSNNYYYPTENIYGQASSTSSSADIYNGNIEPQYISDIQFDHFQQTQNDLREKLLGIQKEISILSSSQNERASFQQPSNN